MTNLIFNPEIEDSLIELLQRIKSEGMGETLEENLLALKTALFVVQEGEPEAYHDLFDTKIGNYLLMNGFVERDFAYNNGDRYKVSKPLYVSLEETTKEITTLNNKNIEAFIDEHVDEFRCLFTKDRQGVVGLRRGAMGDESSLKKKLVAWFKATKFKYSWQDVISTAKQYTDEFILQNNFTYLQAADYFVKKGDRSTLSANIDECKSYTGSVVDSEMGIEDELI